MATPASLRERQQDVEAFLQAFDAMLASCDRIDDWLEGIPTWRAKPGRQHAVGRQQTELHRLTAVAAQTIQWLGLTIEYKPRGTMQTVPVNPVLAWPSMFGEDPVTSADLIRGSCHQAIGLLADMAVKAQAHESSLEVRLVKAVSAPRRIWRAAAGVPHASATHKTAFLAGVAVATVAGIIVAFVAHALHWA